MDKRLKAIALKGVNIPTDGWILWQGDNQLIENSYRQILRLSPCEDLVINSKNINHSEFHIGINIAAIFEWGGLLSNRSLLENLLLPFDYRSKDSSQIHVKINAIYSELKYEQFLHERPFYVPRNVQKLTMILRAFLQEPDCILAFNLSFGLETRDKEFLKKFLQDYRHINAHFSEESLHKPTDFTEVIHTELWEKSA